MANVTANLDSLNEFYAGPDGGPGLKTLVDEAGFADLAGNLLTLLERSYRTSSELGPKLAVLVEDDAARGRIQTIVDDTEDARHMVAGEAAGALGLVLGFNSLDGD
jgi:predicted lipoprotein